MGLSPKAEALSQTQWLEDGFNFSHVQFVSQSSDIQAISEMWLNCGGQIFFSRTADLLFGL